MMTEPMAQIIGAIVAIIGAWLGVRRWQAEREKHQIAEKESLAAVVDNRVKLLLEAYEEDVRDLKSRVRELERERNECLEKLVELQGG